MAAAGFGFSFGDFVQTIQLLNDVRKALRESGGARDEFKLLFIELHHLEIVLQQLIYGSWSDGADAGHLNAVKGLALTCKMHLGDFLAKIEKFQKLGGGEVSGIKGKIRVGTMKVRWAVLMRDEVVKFRDLIMAKVFSINLLLQLNVMSTISKIDFRTSGQDTTTTPLQAQTTKYLEVLSEDILEVRATQQRISRNVTRLVKICAGVKVAIEDFRNPATVQHADIRDLLHRIGTRQSQQTGAFLGALTLVMLRIARVESVLRTLLRTFGNFSSTALDILRQIIKTDKEIYALLQQVQDGIGSSPLSSTQDRIIFTDALGRTRYLSYELFKHWEVVEAMLKCTFKDLPGEDRVRSGQYHVLNAKRKCLVIDKNRWERSVFPGSEVTMSMIITTQVILDGLCLCSQADHPQMNPLPGNTKPARICSDCSLEHHEVDFVFNLNDPTVRAELQEHKRSERLQRMPLSDLMALSRDNQAKRVLNEQLDAFKLVHISFGRGPGPRHGLLSDGQISAADFHEQAYLASQWPLSRVLIWLTDNAFPAFYEAIFRELGLYGHGFLRLQDDTEVLRWRLIHEFECGNLVVRNNVSLDLVGFRQKVDEDLARLLGLVGDALNLTKRLVRQAFDQDAWTMSRGNATATRSGEEENQ